MVMKNNLLFIVILLLSCVCFTACDDDDDKLSGIISTVESKIEGTISGTVQFIYEGDRLVKVVDGRWDEIEIYQFAYADLDSVFVKCEVGSSFNYEFVYKLENGRAVSVIEKEDSYYNEYAIEYDNDCLKQISDGQTIYTYIWDGENIVKVVDEGGKIDFEGEVTKYENKANIDYNALFTIFSDDYFITAAAYADILGKKSKNFIVPKGEVFNISSKDGYITKISATYSDEEIGPVKEEADVNYK